MVTDSLGVARQDKDAELGFLAGLANGGSRTQVDDIMGGGQL